MKMTFVVLGAALAIAAGACEISEDELDSETEARLVDELWESLDDHQRWPVIEQGFDYRLRADASEASVHTAEVGTIFVYEAASLEGSLLAMQRLEDELLSVTFDAEGDASSVELRALVGWRADPPANYITCTGCHGGNGSEFAGGAGHGDDAADAD